MLDVANFEGGEHLCLLTVPINSYQIAMCACANGDLIRFMPNLFGDANVDIHLYIIQLLSSTCMACIIYKIRYYLIQ